MFNDYGFLQIKQANCSEGRLVCARKFLVTFTNINVAATPSSAAVLVIPCIRSNDRWQRSNKWCVWLVTAMGDAMDKVYAVLWLVNPSSAKIGQARVTYVLAILPTQGHAWRRASTADQTKRTFVQHLHERTMVRLGVRERNSFLTGARSNDGGPVAAPLCPLSGVSFCGIGGCSTLISSLRRKSDSSDRLSAVHADHRQARRPGCRRLLCSKASLRQAQ